MASSSFSTSKTDPDVTVARLRCPAYLSSCAHGDYLVLEKVESIRIVVVDEKRHATWGGVYCMVTDSGFRRQGIGSAILAAGARWALDCGTERLYLQVKQANHAARGLYGASGFAHAYSYHYRIAGR